MLTFNTYNEVLHFFVEPRGPSDIDGYAGDYEFIIREATPGQIVMTGKKYGNQVVMTPYSGGDATTWKGYLEQLSTLYRKMEAPVYAVKVDGAAAAIKRVTRKGRTFRFAYDNPENDKTVPYLMTPTGIKLYEPLTVDGKTAQYFTLDTIAETLTSVEPEHHIVIGLSALPPNEFLAETPTYWYLNITKSSSSVRALIDTCAANVSKGESEKLTSIIIGQSPLGIAYPGRGLVLNSSTGAIAYDAQFLYDFTPAGNNVDIKYKGQGLNGGYYYTYYKELLDALTAKSPYSVKVDNPKKTTEMTITSVADPAFYFIVAL
jgi:hypothetical protein